jgi:hypothetical protein
MELIRKRSDLLLLTGAMCAAALVHAAALGNYLVSDSWVFVYPRSLAETFRYFFTSIIPPEGEAYWLRPLPMFLFWLENVLLPGTGWLPHLTNILFHTLNVFLLWKLTETLLTAGGTRRGSDAAPAAFAACLVYGLHPLTVGSVDWVAARFDVVSVTFGLAGTIFWLRWDAEMGRGRDLLIGLALLVCSLLSKEQGVVFFGACGFLAFLRILRRETGGKPAWTGIGILTGAGIGYFLYRLVIFGGIGGYVTARNPLSIMPPVNYLAAVLFPYPNIFPQWRFTWEFWAAAALVILAFSLAWAVPRKKPIAIVPGRAYAVIVLLALGLLTTVPNPGLTLGKVVGHAESRFALIPVAASALLVGIAVSLIRSTRAYRAALALLFAWSIAAAWRTSVQIQAWESAGFAARSIITQTLLLVPNPPQGSRLVFLDIPRNNSQYAYIFGIGLDYALMSAYGRTDLAVIRFPRHEDLQHANPDRDAVLQFHKDTGQLERLRGRKVKRPGQTP